MLPSALSFLILVLGIRLRSTCLQGTCFTNKDISLPWILWFLISYYFTDSAQSVQQTLSSEGSCSFACNFKLFPRISFYLCMCDFKDWFFLCVGVFSLHCMCPTHRGQKRMLNPLGPELPAVVSLHAVLWDELDPQEQWLLYPASLSSILEGIAVCGMNHPSRLPIFPAFFLVFRAI